MLDVLAHVLLRLVGLVGGGIVAWLVDRDLRSVLAVLVLVHQIDGVLLGFCLLDLLQGALQVVQV